MNWLTIVILAIPVGYIFNGIQRGMIRTAFSLASVILTLVLGFVINPYVTEFLQENTPVYDVIQKKCEESITENTELKLNEKIDPQAQKQFIESLPLPESIRDKLVENNNAQGYNHFLAESFGEYISHSIASVALGIIGLILTFIVVSIILHLVSGLLNGIFSLPILSLINRAGGAVLGAVQGLFIVWIIFLLLSLFWDTQWARTGISLIKENQVTGYLYQNNLLAEIFLGLSH